MLINYLGSWLLLLSPNPPPNPPTSDSQSNLSIDKHTGLTKAIGLETKEAIFWSRDQGSYILVSRPRKLYFGLETKRAIFWSES
jgi:hypothetical protein